LENQSGNLLKKTYDILSRFLAYEFNTSPITKCEKNVPRRCVTPGHHTTYVTKWVDYSNRYGLGYVLNDCRGCVSFLDGAVVTLDCSNRLLAKYRPRGDMNEVLIDIRRPVINNITALSHLSFADNFVRYMDSNLMSAAPNVFSFSTNLICDSCSKPTKSKITELINWKRSENHMMFLFADSTFQVNFLDTHVKIIIDPSVGTYCADNLCVTYMDPNQGVYLIAVPMIQNSFKALTKNQARVLVSSFQKVLPLLREASAL